MKFELIDEVLLKKFHEAIERKEEGIDLVAIVNELKSEGKNQRQVYDIFGEYLEYIAEHGTEEQDDYVRDVMDRIYGWCDPDYKLFDSILGDADDENRI